MANALRIAVATRGRPDTLARLVSSIAACEAPGVPTAVEVVDDGQIEAETLDGWRRALDQRNIGFSYRKKSGEDMGAYRSRQMVADLAQEDLLLYLDDDVELFPDYLKKLVEQFLAMPDMAGMGGVDQLALRYRPTRRLLNLVQMSAALSPGRLSISGYGRSNETWPLQTETFETEFLHGCNMAFRTRALAGRLPQIPSMRSYSSGDDLVTSVVARRTGPLYVDPDLKVLHHKDPGARDNRLEIFERGVLNTKLLLHLLGAGHLRRLALVWTISVQALLAAATGDFARARTQVRALLLPMPPYAYCGPVPADLERTARDANDSGDTTRKAYGRESAR